MEDRPSRHMRNTGDPNGLVESPASPAVFFTRLIATSLVLISGLSYKITHNNELWTSSFPLYSIKPNLRNLFMKKLTRDRVVPIISATTQPRAAGLYLLEATLLARNRREIEGERGRSPLGSEGMFKARLSTRGRCS
jgi:hypothetical protein